jgi:hypothetical protein
MTSAKSAAAALGAGEVDTAARTILARADRNPSVSTASMSVFARKHILMQSTAARISVIGYANAGEVRQEAFR